MAWSDNISMCDLSDEPSLSEDLIALIGDQAASFNADDGGRAQTAVLVAKEAEPSVHIVLNMSDVTYINSSNISQLIQLRKVQSRAGRMLVLCCLQEDVFDVLRVTGVDRLFRIVPDPLTALTAIQLDMDSQV